GATEKQIRQTVADWLAIHRNYQLNGAVIPPSSSRLVRDFEDLAHTITVRAVQVPASKFIDALPATMPSDSQVTAMFEKYKDVRAGDCSDRSPLGFGYLQPQKAAIACLLVNHMAISRVIVPDRNQMIDYYNDPSHADEFMVSVPATQPATAGGQAGGIKRKLGFAEAAPAIARKLTEPAVNQRIDALIARIQDKIRNVPMTEFTIDPYPTIVKSMTLPADDVLDKPLGMVVFSSQPLEDIVAALAEKAGLNAICYPWGKQGPNTLDPQVRLSLPPKNRTLRQALADMDSQIRARMISDWPELRWAGFETVDKAIFPVAQQARTGPAATQPDLTVEMFPVRSLQTGLMELHQLRGDEIFGTARDPVSPKVTIADYAFGGRTVGEDDRKMPALEAGKEGPVMIFGFQDSAGSMLWRVTQRRDAQVPAEIDPDIRRQIGQDIKIEQAFELAKFKALQISQSGNLQPEGFRSGLIGPFARKSIRYNPLIMMELGCGRASESLFIEKAFALAKGQADYGKSVVVPLPADRMAVVAALADEMPALMSEFQSDSEYTVVMPFRADRPGIATIEAVTTGAPYILTVDVRPDTPTARRFFDAGSSGAKVSAAPGQTFQIRIDADPKTFKVSGDCVTKAGEADFVPGRKFLARYETGLRYEVNMRNWFGLAGVSSRTDFKSEK
ncbi:MAG: hypothetical protein HZA50_05815, partial [Planctomycetes bacterium]|nr:hypothetical protein [Planctomycetota bacterium]